MMQGSKKAAPKRTADPYKLEVAARIYAAFTAMGRKRQRGNELTQADVGRLVARELKRAEPFPQATVSSWMSNRDPAMPDPPTMLAIARVLETDVMWLMFGARTD